jgi:hypothetical protein
VKIEVVLRVTEKHGYETEDIAVSKLEVEHLVETFSARDLTRALNDVLDDASNRLEVQLRTVEKARRAKEEALLDA